MLDISNRLFNELHGDPEGFYRDGKKCCDLLGCYFEGLDIFTLDGLLKSDNEFKIRVAVFILNELGIRAQPLVEWAPFLLSKNDRKISYNILEILLVCATGQFSSFFSYILSSLSSPDSVIRKLSMRLCIRASTSQLIEGVREAGRVDPSLIHLNILIDGKGVDSKWLYSEDPILRKIYVISLFRSNEIDGFLIEELRHHWDGDVAQFRP